MFDAVVLTEPSRLRFLGVETGTRTTIIRLADGLFVHSPGPLDEAMRARVAALGPVVAIVAPSKFHNLYAADWARAWPDAVLCGCPGVITRRPEVAWAHTLGDTPHPLWKGRLEQVHFAARTLEDEVVFFEPRGRTLLCADAIFNLGAHPDPFTRAVAWGLGNTRPGATWLERLLIRDRRAAREQVDRMLSWGAEKILLAHGPSIDAGGNEVLRDAYAWL